MIFFLSSFEDVVLLNIFRNIYIYMENWLSASTCIFQRKWLKLNKLSMSEKFIYFDLGNGVLLNIYMKCH